MLVVVIGVSSSDSAGAARHRLGPWRQVLVLEREERLPDLAHGRVKARRGTASQVDAESRHPRADVQPEKRRCTDPRNVLLSIIRHIASQTALTWSSGSQTPSLRASPIRARSRRSRASGSDIIDPLR